MDKHSANVRRITRVTSNSNREKELTRRTAKKVTTTHRRKENTRAMNETGLVEPRKIINADSTISKRSNKRVTRNNKEKLCLETEKQKALSKPSKCIKRTAQVCVKEAIAERTRCQNVDRESTSQCTENQRYNAKNDANETAKDRNKSGCVKLSKLGTKTSCREPKVRSKTSQRPHTCKIQGLTEANDSKLKGKLNQTNVPDFSETTGDSKISNKHEKACLDAKEDLDEIDSSHETEDLSYVAYSKCGSSSCSRTTKNERNVKIEPNTTNEILNQLYSSNEKIVTTTDHIESVVINKKRTKPPKSQIDIANNRTKQIETCLDELNRSHKPAKTITLTKSLKKQILNALQLKLCDPKPPEEKSEQNIKTVAVNENEMHNKSYDEIVVENTGHLEHNDEILVENTEHLKQYEEVPTRIITDAGDVIPQISDEITEIVDENGQTVTVTYAEVQDPVVDGPEVTFLLKSGVEAPSTLPRAPVEMSPISLGTLLSKRFRILSGVLDTSVGGKKMKNLLSQDTSEGGKELEDRMEDTSQGERDSKDTSIGGKKTKVLLSEDISQGGKELGDNSQREKELEDRNGGGMELEESLNLEQAMIETNVVDDILPPSKVSNALMISMK